MRQALGFLALGLICWNSVGVAAAAPPNQEQCSNAKVQPGADWAGEYWPEVPEIAYEGPNSKNPFAYRYYNAEEVIHARPMREWLRFSVAFWHTFRGYGDGPFGSATRVWPWEADTASDMDLAKRRMRALFELLRKLGLRYWTFHDRDIAPEGVDWHETNANLDVIVRLAAQLQEESGVRPLWGTAQLFKHPRYKDGAATASDPLVFAYAAAQTKKAMKVTHKLGGENYVFWGGREGYTSLLTTDMQLELKNYAKFLHMAVSYKERLQFQGQLLIEPKPQEPTKHQYDWDAGTTLHFLAHNNLTDHFRLNVECNHATLAGHSCEHELRFASMYGALGSIDANSGDPQVGWDTDQFLTDPRDSTLLMAAVLDNGGLAPGGLNFDAKLRRESTDPRDLFYAHIASIDALARGLRAAVQLKNDGLLDDLRSDRYAPWFAGCHGLANALRLNRVAFEQLEQHVLHNVKPEVPGSQNIELAEMYLAMAMDSVPGSS